MNCDDLAVMKFEFCEELIQINTFALKIGDVVVTVVINDAFTVNLYIRRRVCIRKCRNSPVYSHRFCYK
jgi:hypothetical protein